MKNIIYILLGSLLFTVGCESSDNLQKSHQVLCLNEPHTLVTFNGHSIGPVYAFDLNGHNILFFKDVSGKNVIIDLVKNDCGVD